MSEMCFVFVKKKNLTTNQSLSDPEKMAFAV